MLCFMSSATACISAMPFFPSGRVLQTHCRFEGFMYFGQLNDVLCKGGPFCLLPTELDACLFERHMLFQLFQWRRPHSDNIWCFLVLTTTTYSLGSAGKKLHRAEWQVKNHQNRCDSVA